MSVLEEVAAAHAHQTAKYGPDSDDRMDFGQLLEAAVALIDENPAGWPWGEAAYARFDKLTHRERLIAAAALLVSEVERIDRSHEREGTT